MEANVQNLPHKDIIESECIECLLDSGIAELGRPRLATDQPNSSGFGQELCIEMQREPLLVVNSS